MKGDPAADERGPSGTSLADYRPRILSGTQWAEVGPRLIELVVAIRPRDRRDAVTHLSRLGRYLQAVMPEDVAGEPVERWLSEQRLSAWAAAAIANREVAPGSVEPIVTTVRRIIASVEGIPSPTSAAPTPRRGPPAIDWDRLESAVAQHAQAAAALAAAKGAGVADRRGQGARFVLAGDEVLLELRNGERKQLHGVDDLARRLVGIQITQAAWAELRDVANRIGVPLSAQAVNDTWILHTLSGTSVLDALNSGIGHQRISWALPRLPRPDPEQVRAALRGTGDASASRAPHERVPRPAAVGYADASMERDRAALLAGLRWERDRYLAAAAKLDDAIAVMEQTPLGADEAATGDAEPDAAHRDPSPAATNAASAPPATAARRGPMTTFDAVLRVFERAEGPMNLKELHRAITALGLDVQESSLRSTLANMVRRGLLVRVARAVYALAPTAAQSGPVTAAGHLSSSHEERWPGAPSVP